MVDVCCGGRRGRGKKGVEESAGIVKGPECFGLLIGDQPVRRNARRVFQQKLDECGFRWSATYPS
jgi:hypothetical protein